MLDISLKIMGLSKDYTFKELEDTYLRLLRANGSEIEIINDAYKYLKEDLKNRENLRSIFEKKERKQDVSINPSVISYNLAKALEYNFDGDLKTALRNFEINSLNDAIRFFELSNYYDALKKYNDGFSKNYKK